MGCCEDLLYPGDGVMTEFHERNDMENTKSDAECSQLLSVGVKPKQRDPESMAVTAILVKWLQGDFPHTRVYQVGQGGSRFDV